MSQIKKKKRTLVLINPREKEYGIFSVQIMHASYRVVTSIPLARSVTSCISELPSEKIGIADP